MRLRTRTAKLLYISKHIAAFFLLFLICFFGQQSSGTNSTAAFGFCLTMFVCLWVGMIRRQGTSTLLIAEETGLRFAEYLKFVALPLLIFMTIFWIVMRAAE